MSSFCIVTQYLGLGGGEGTKLEAFLRFAETRGHACDIYYPEEGPYPQGQIEALRSFSAVGNIYGTSVPVRAPHFLRAGLFGRRCKFVRGYDAYLLISTALTLGMPLLRQKRRFVAWPGCTYNAEIRGLPRTKLRHYVLYNSLTNRASWRQEMLCAKQAAAILAVSRSSSRQIISELGVPAPVVGVLPVPIDVEQFVPSSQKPLNPTILSVARLDRRKEFPTLLRAFKAVVGEIKNAQLRIVGSGPELDSLVRLTGQLGMSESVEFLGQVPNERLIEEYQGAHVFALSSRQEGLGIVFLEALACGLPLVATDSGGSADPVVEGQTGFLVPVGDWQQLASRLLQLMRDPELVRQLSRQARVKAVEEYSTRVIYKRLDSVFHEAFGIETSPRNMHTSLGSV